MILYLLYSVAILTLVFSLVYFIFSNYIRKHHNSNDFFSNFSDGIYSGISTFYAPYSPYMPGFKNIKFSYIVKSIWTAIYIIVTSILMYFDIPSLLSCIPLFLSTSSFFAEKKLRNSMVRAFEFDKGQGLADDSSYETFVKIYGTLYYYQITMTALLLPLSLLLLYIGFSMNVI